ncbi:hypothetical protein DFH09DRAFT_1081521 [Mycena vulgaris]|nr:hypothetical protein DFH09DRAFT_1081521 [Mycena vulgaris]
MFDGSTPAVKKAMTDEAEAYNLQLEAGPSAEELRKRSLGKTFGSEKDVDSDDVTETRLVSQLWSHWPRPSWSSGTRVGGKKGPSDLTKFKYSAEEQTRLMKWGKQLLVRVLQDEDGTLILPNNDPITLSRHELLASLSEYFEAGGATVRVPITRESERVLVDLEKAAVEEIREYYGITPIHLRYKITERYICKIYAGKITQKARRSFPGWLHPNQTAAILRDLVSACISTPR